MEKEKFKMRKEVKELISTPGAFSHPLSKVEIEIVRNEELERLTNEIYSRLINLGHF